MSRDGPRYPHRFLAICTVLAPFFAFLASLIEFQSAGKREGELVFIALRTQRHLASNALWLAPSVLFIPAALGLLALVPDRLYRWGLVETALLLPGGFGHGVVISYSMVQIPLVQSDLTREAVSTFITTDMYAHPAFYLLVLFLGFYLGFLAFAIVLWHGDVAPQWVAVLMVIALVLGLWNHAAKNELMTGLLTIALGYLAYQLWTRKQGQPL